METSVFLASIIGPVLLIIGLGILLNLEHYRSLVREFAGSAFNVYLTGALDLLLGAMIVRFHNVWTWRWPVLITLLGWLMIVRGVVRIGAPGLVQRMAQHFTRSTSVLTIGATVSLLLGATLTFFTYFTAP